MARSGRLKPVPDRRLSDLVLVGLLTRVLPPEVVDEVIAGCGRRERRHRSLPARVMAYFAVGMALHSDGSHEEVMALMTDGLAWVDGDAEPPKLPSKSGIFQARERLGAEPLKALFDRVDRPLATESTPGAWLAGRRLVAIDGTTLDVADSVVNDEFFGRPGVNKGEKSAFVERFDLGVLNGEPQSGITAPAMLKTAPVVGGLRNASGPLNVEKRTNFGALPGPATRQSSTPVTWPASIERSISIAKHSLVHSLMD